VRPSEEARAATKFRNRAQVAETLSDLPSATGETGIGCVVEKKLALHGAGSVPLKRFVNDASGCVDGVDANQQGVVEQAQQGAQFGTAWGEYFAVAQGAGVDELFERRIGAYYVVEGTGVVAGLQGKVIEIEQCGRRERGPRERLRERVSRCSHERPPRISVCYNRRTRFQTRAAARTGWKTGKLLQETGRARALPSEPPKTGARTKKPQTLRGDCGFRRRVSNGLPNPITLFTCVMESVYLQDHRQHKA
jgi:hypothetical protein